MSEIHCFQKAGLGTAPFHCVGMASIPSASMAEHNPTAYNNALAALPRGLGMGSCAYCGTAIVHNFIIKSSDERRFVVGCDCVARTGDAGLVKEVRRERVRIATEARTAKRAMKAADREAAWKLERANRAANFAIEHAALIERAKNYFDLGGFVKDVITRGLDGGYMSDKMIAAVDQAITTLAETERLRMVSKFVGEVGKRETFEVRVQKINYYSRPSFGAPWLNETVYITTLRDQDDNAIVVKSPAFKPVVGERLKIKATVKEHNGYRGESQTLVQRVKVL